MRYNKPQIAKLADAVHAIMGQHKAERANVDAPDNKVKTIGAYEADE